MSRFEKAVTRLQTYPKDFTWRELEPILKHFGYVEMKGAGSRRKFVNPKKNVTINLHEPHPKMEYKNHTGNVKFSKADHVFFGTIQNIKDLITFEGKTPEELTEAFHRVVDELLDKGQKIFQQPKKTQSRIDCKLSSARAHNLR